MGIKYVFNPTTGNLDATSVETPAGSTTQVQFNDAGSFGGDADLTWNKTTNVLGITGDVNLSDGGTFTTTLQTITPTANRTVSIPDATGTVALVAGSSGQVVYNNAGAYAGVSTMTFDGTNVTLAGRLINSYTSVASSPAKVFTGTWFTGGTGTTTKPHFLIEPTGTTSTAWSTSGTGLGVNAASGFAGNLLDLQVNGTSQARISNSGAATVASVTTTNAGGNSVVATRDIVTSTFFRWNNSTNMAAAVNGQLTITNSAANDFDRINLGGTTSSFPALKRNSAKLQVRLADDSGFTDIDAKTGTFTGDVLTSGGNMGFATGSGGAVTQATDRTTGVTLNKSNGAITLVSAAGTTSWTSFTVTNSTVAATDVVNVCQKSGTDKYQIFVTNVGAGTFEITFATTGGTTTEQPVFNFAVTKAVAT